MQISVYRFPKNIFRTSGFHTQDTAVMKLDSVSQVYAVIGHDLHLHKWNLVCRWCYFILVLLELPVRQRQTLSQIQWMFCTQIVFKTSSSFTRRRVTAHLSRWDTYSFDVFRSYTANANSRWVQ